MQVGECQISCSGLGDLCSTSEFIFLRTYTAALYVVMTLCLYTHMHTSWQCSTTNDRPVGTAVSSKDNVWHHTEPLLRSVAPSPPWESPYTPTAHGRDGGVDRGARDEGALNDSHRRRPSHGIPEPEQEAERRLLGKQWPGTSVMRGCTPLRLQWVRGTSQRWLSFLSPPFRGHFCPLQWAFCPLPAFCQRLTLRVCSFFCLFFLSPLENKT